MTTDYIFPLPLWLAVRRHDRPDGTCLVEPAWVGSGEHSGLAVFVSRLHAQLYATLRNAFRAPDDFGNWQCMPLRAFELSGHIRDTNGTLNCEMAFGFACDSDGALIVANGAPRLRYAELTFDLPEDSGAVIFNFSQRAFDAMRDQWASIGAHEYERSIDRTEVMDNATFLKVLDVALWSVVLTSDQPEGDHWTVYDADAGRWVSSAELWHAGLQAVHTLH